MAVVEEGVGAELTQVSINAPDGQIHLGQFPCGGVGVLPIDRNAVDVPAVVFDKPRRLDKHAAAAAAWVIDPPIEGLEHFHQRFDHTLRREELPGQLALLLGEFPQAVLVGVPQNILAVSVLYHLEVSKQIDHIAQPPLVQLRAGKILGEDVFQLFVFLFNTAHGIVDHCADFRRMGGGGDHAPPGILRHEEDVFGCILVDIFLKTVTLSHKFIIFSLETVRDVF